MYPPMQRISHIPITGISVTMAQSSIVVCLLDAMPRPSQNAAHSAQNTIQDLHIITLTFTTIYCPVEGPQ